jgi:hypothetical protein
VVCSKIPYAMERGIVIAEKVGHSGESWEGMIHLSFKIEALVAVAALVLVTPSGAQEILIFGGEGHREFLGCLNCNEFATNSIWNEFSTYGWEERLRKVEFVWPLQE